MGWVLGILAATLGVVFLWGAIAPRSQWRALSAWSVSDEHAQEPGGAAYGWRRLLSALGALGIATVVVVASTAAFTPPASTVKPPTLAEEMWGSPAPSVVDRIITPIGETPAGLLQMPIIDYQSFDDEDGLPDYLDGLNTFAYLGKLDFPGYIGTIPEVGFSALDNADLVVHVSGALLCVPRQVAVIESDVDVKIGVYYGVPDPAADTPAPDNTVACATDGAVTSSVLIPVDLQSPLGDRILINPDGTPITDVPLP